MRNMINCLRCKIKMVKDNTQQTKDSRETNDCWICSKCGSRRNLKKRENYDVNYYKSHPERRKACIERVKRKRELEKLQRDLDGRNGGAFNIK